MEETYEEIVRTWYLRLRDSFVSILMNNTNNGNLRLSEVENIYQNVFLAIRKNLQNGRISPDTNWRSYIMRVGINMMRNKFRSPHTHVSVEDLLENPDREKFSKMNRLLNEKLSYLSTLDDDDGIYNSPEAHDVLNDELRHIPQPCASIISLKYYDNLTDSEIAKELPPYCNNGKPVSVNAEAIKARRWLCMKDLIYRVKLGLYNAGLIAEKPQKNRRHGK